MSAASLSRPAALLAFVALASSSTSAHAQFGGLLGAFGRSANPAPRAEATTSQGCPEGKKKSAGAAILGSMAGSLTSRVAGRFATFVPIPEVADMLTNAIACKLDAKEQKQAADATLEATRGDAKVGQAAEWTSSSRENVKGTSTVTAVNQATGGGLQCITVTDVVIVNGEEARANKKMCKPKGGARYSLMA